ncbi:MAG: AMP-binding protein, partial [Bacteroidales bacterium]|nr:AMP-binding protein [Bacteroidales bacterium]
MKQYGKTLAVEHANFVDILQYQAKTQANEIAYIFLVNGEDEEIRLTYSELDIRAKSIAMELTKVCSVGDRALLMFPSCLDFIFAFFG